MDYSNFDLEITQTSRERAYSVRVVHSPAGEARETVHFPFTQTEIKDRLDALQHALRHNGDVYRGVPPEEQNVRDFGQCLFEVLFPSTIRSLYAASLTEVTHQKKRLRINLRIQAPELADLPWEYLYDKGRREYICFSRITPIVRYLDIPQPIQSLSVSLPLRILGMTATPSDQVLLNIEHEKRLIHDALHNLEERGLVEIDWMSKQTCRSLQNELRKDPNRPYHIFHFIGHGGFDPVTNEGAIALVHEDTGKTEMVPATKLARVLMNHPSLRLVILNACEGARGSKHDIFSSTASLLALQGIPATIAMQYVIADKAAIGLARAFYEALADGMAVDEAVTEARVSMSMSTLEWGVPVLYMHSHDGKLFDIPQETLQQEVSVSLSVTPTNSRTDVSVPATISSPSSAPINKRGRFFTRRWFIGTSVGLVAVGTTLGVIAYKQYVGTGSNPVPPPVPGVGGWSPTGSMQNKRYNYSATPLLDGTVLVAAGRNSETTLVVRAERFNREQGIWTDAGKPHTPRLTATNSLVTLPKGKYQGHALLVGGANTIQNSDYDTCELYNPASNSWSDTGSLNQARRGAVVIVLPDGRVMVIGGAYGLPNKYRFQRTCELFDPDTGQWTYTQGQLAVPRENALAVLLPNETILIAGGEGPDGVTPSAEIYHIATGTFSSAASLPWERMNATMTAFSDGKVLLAGGVNQDRQRTEKAVLYDYQTKEWIVISQMNEQRDEHAAFLLSGDRVLVSGGGGGSTLSSSEVFDLASETWSPGPRFTTPRATYRIVSLKQKQFLAIGGYDGTVPVIGTGGLASCELFTPDPS